MEGRVMENFNGENFSGDRKSRVNGIGCACRKSHRQAVIEENSLNSP
jgi:hypothetical protein